MGVTTMMEGPAAAPSAAATATAMDHDPIVDPPSLDHIRTDGGVVTAATTTHTHNNKNNNDNIGHHHHHHHHHHHDDCNSNSNQHVFSPELLKLYYARLFPYSFLHTWLSYNPSNNNDKNKSSTTTTTTTSSQSFTRREFSFTLEPIPGEEIYIRYQSFSTEQEFKAAVVKRQPRKIDIGAIFSHPPKDKNSYPPHVFTPVQRELVFDIDLTDYDGVRNCGCSGAKICPICWTFMQMACTVMHDGLKEDFGFQHIAWFYSGRRGIHAWICDEEARALTNEARSAVANYFEVSVNKKKSEGLTYPLHPMLVRAYKVLEPYFCQYVLPSENGHGLFATQTSWEDVLDTKLPEGARPTVGANLKNKWAKDPYGTSPQEKWKQLLRHLRVKFDLPTIVGNTDDAGGLWWDGNKDTTEDDGGFGNRSNSSRKRIKKATTQTSSSILDEEKQRIALWPVELVFEYTYPRLDINVSKMQNHLLKSPFCVHPKTGRVCVPIQPETVDDFDPFAVPTLAQLAKELDEYHSSTSTSTATNTDEMDEDDMDVSSRKNEEEQQRQREREQIVDWKKTSLKGYFEAFEKGFLEPLQKDLRRKQRDRAEASAAVRGDF